MMVKNQRLLKLSFYLTINLLRAVHCFQDLRSFLWLRRNIQNDVTERKLEAFILKYGAIGS